MARRKEGTSYGGDFEFEEIFMSLQPHFALRSNPNEDHYLRICIDILMKLLLPSYEYNCDAVRFLLNGVLLYRLKLLLHKVAEPVFIYGSILQVQLILINSSWRRRTKATFLRN
jgi:hypothetical protein